MKNKVVNRTQVYRAVYYSGFDWSKTRVASMDSYKLVEASTKHTIYMDHQHDDELNKDVIVVRTSDTLENRDIERFSRLYHKILRRTRDLIFKQDILDGGTNESDK